MVYINPMIGKLNKGIEEAERFILAAERARERITKDSGSSKEMGACKRASMDLTRALAELRNP